MNRYLGGFFDDFYKTFKMGGSVYILVCVVLSSESEYCSAVQCKLLFILCNGVCKSKMCIKQGVLEHSESYVCNILCIIQCAYFAVVRVHQAVCAMCAGQTETGCNHHHHHHDVIIIIIITMIIMIVSIITIRWGDIITITIA